MDKHRYNLASSKSERHPQHLPVSRATTYAPGGHALSRAVGTSGTTPGDHGNLYEPASSFMGSATAVAASSVVNDWESNHQER